MTFNELLQPHMLPFVLPFVAGLLLVLVQAFGFTGHETEFEGGEAHLEVDHDVDAEHGIEHHMDHDAHHEPSAITKVFSFLGFGRVPFSIIMMSFCLIWGFLGWGTSMVLKNILVTPWLYFWPSLATAAVGAVLLTRYIALGIAKVMPSTETYVSANEGLVSKFGVVRYPVTENAGTVSLYDDHKNYLEVQCRVSPGEGAIPEGARVVLMRYDDENEVFLVRRDAAEQRGLIKRS